MKVQAGQTAQLPVTLRTDHDGHGGLNGTVPVHVAALDNPSDAQVVDVPFVASLIQPLNTTNFVLVLIAALLLGPGIPLALLYASKWWVSKIPDTPMLAERIPVEVNNDVVLRDGEPFAMADTDLIQPVPGPGRGHAQAHGARCDADRDDGPQPVRRRVRDRRRRRSDQRGFGSCRQPTAADCARCCRWPCTTSGWCCTIPAGRRTSPRCCCWSAGAPTPRRASDSTKTSRADYPSC